MSDRFFLFLRRNYTQVAWSVLCAFAVFSVYKFVAALSGSTPALMDPDAALRLTQVRQWMTGVGFFDHSVLHTNTPFGGVATPWTRPLDMILVMASYLSPASADITYRLLLASAWVPVLFGVMAAFVMTRAARLCFDTRLADVIVVFLCLIPAFQMSTIMGSLFIAGMTDHHGLLSLLWCGALYTILSDRTVKAQMALGLILGLMLWISPEGLMLWIIVYGAMAIDVFYHPSSIRQAVPVSLIAALTVTAGLLVEQPVQDIFTNPPMYDTLSLPYVVLAWVIAIASLALSYLFKRVKKFNRRHIFTAAVAAAASLGLMWFLFPKIFKGPLVDADPFIFSDFMPSVSEVIPLFSREKLEIFSLIFMPQMAGFFLWRAHGSRLSDENRRRLFGVSFFLSVFTLMCCIQTRFYYYMIPTSFVAFAAYAPYVLSRARPQKKSWVAALPRLARVAFFVTCILCVFSLVFSGFKKLDGNIVKAGPCSEMITIAVQNGGLRALIGEGDKTLMIIPNAAPVTLFYTPYKIIAGNYHREGQGLSDLKKITEFKTFKEAIPLLKKRQIDYLVTCPFDTMPYLWMHKKGDRSWLLGLDKKSPHIKPVPGLIFQDKNGKHALVYKLRLP